MSLVLAQIADWKCRDVFALRAELDLYTPGGAAAPLSPAAAGTGAARAGICTGWGQGGVQPSPAPRNICSMPNL